MQRYGYIWSFERPIMSSGQTAEDIWTGREQRQKWELALQSKGFSHRRYNPWNSEGEVRGREKARWAVCKAALLEKAGLGSTAFKYKFQGT